MSTTLLGYCQSLFEGKDNGANMDKFFNDNLHSLIQMVSLSGYFDTMSVLARRTDLMSQVLH